MNQSTEPDDWPRDTTRDRLIGDWYLYQRKGGHRTSTDDLITAWYAVHREGGNPAGRARYLDLGCGIGSVMLMVTHKLSPRVIWGVEAQTQSFAMAKRSVSELRGENYEFHLVNKDFRSTDFGEQKFDLITASPPYFPLGTGVLPSDAQRRACRFETRGGVEAYLETASKVLSPRGHMYLVFQTAGRQRVLAAAEAWHLHLCGQADFRMRSDRDQPFLSVYEFSLLPCTSLDRFTCSVREPDGSISFAYQGIRRELGIAPGSSAPGVNPSSV